MHLDLIYSLDFTFMLSWIKPAQSCLNYFYSSLAVTFWEQLVWSDCLIEEGSFPQRVTKIMISYVREWKNCDLSHLISFRKFQKPHSEWNCAMWLDLTPAPPLRLRGSGAIVKSNPRQIKNSFINSFSSGRLLRKILYGNHPDNYNDTYIYRFL